MIRRTVTACKVKWTTRISWLLLALFVACTKENAVVSNPPKALLSKVDTINDAKNALSRNNFTLFSKALRRAGLDTLVRPENNYTIFAPTDTALMKAGYTANVISTLAPDSLNKVFSYLIIQGEFKDSSVRHSTGSIPGRTLKTEFFTNKSLGFQTYVHFLFFDFKDGIFLDGNKVATAVKRITASNGFIYSIDSVIRPATQTLYEAMRDRPELTYYLAAIHISDSINSVVYGAYDPTQSYNFTIYDSALFARIQFVSDFNFSHNPEIEYQPTVFAPTNAAFERAGFATIESIRKYAIANAPYGIADLYNNPLKIDKIVKQHILFNTNNPNSLTTTYDFSHPYKIFYSDFFDNPFLSTSNANATVANAVIFYGGYAYGYNYFPPVYDTLRFALIGQGVGVQYKATTPPSLITAPSIMSNVNAYNGTLFEVDKLFFPPLNK